MCDDIGAGQRESLIDAVKKMASVMEGRPLTQRIAELESTLSDADVATASQAITAADIDVDALRAAWLVRQSFGRISDVIHAFVIALSLPHILKEGEQIERRPSLAAGNDPTRRFDLETSLRVAEFKLAVWNGRDSMRQKTTFVDVVNLAMYTAPDEVRKDAYLYVVGDRPGNYLTKSDSSVATALSRASHGQRERFTDQYGDSSKMTVSSFVQEHASHVHVVDLATIVPAVEELAVAQSSR